MENNEGNELNNSTPKRKKHRVRRFLARFFIGLGIAIALLGCVVAWLLKPERLTPLIERVVDEHLIARLEIGSAELTFWKDFPRLKIEIDDLRLISRSLDSISPELRTSLPANADSLIYVGHFEGGVNILKALTGKVALSDVTIDRPRVNLLSINDSLSNFAIFPVSPPDTATTKFPEIYINRFAVTNAEPITYRSLSDTIDISLLLQTIELSDKAPLYELVADTRIETPILREVAYDRIRFNLDGGIGWSAEEPYRLKLEALQVGLAELNATISSDIDFSQQLTVNSLKLNVDSLDITSLLGHLPEQYRAAVEPLHTDMRVNLNAELLRPYTLSDPFTLPMLRAGLQIPDCFVDYRLTHFDTLSADITADIDGTDLNRSVVNINRLLIDGRALDVDLSAVLTDLLTDPKAKGSFTGAIDFGRLPAILTDRLAARVSGRIKGHTDFSVRASDFTPQHFHNLYFDGDLALNAFRFESLDSVTAAYVRSASLHFGSNERMKNRNGQRLDSILMVKFSADTASIRTDGLRANARGIKATLGTANNFSTADTTVITPFGGVFSIERLLYNSIADTIKIALADASGIGLLRRYNSDKKIPQLDLKLGVSRVGVRHPDYMAAVGASSIEATAHIRPRAATRRPGLDGSRRSHIDDGGTARTDSSRVARTDRRGSSRPDRRSSRDSLSEMLDFNVDNSLKSLLFRWDIKGEIKSARGAMRLSAINLPNTFSNLDLSVSSDSVALNSLTYRLGHSDLNFNGVISNLRGALASRRPTPLRFDLNVVSDTININEVVHALSAPAVSKVEHVGGDIDMLAEAELHEFEDPEVTPDSIMGPLLIPVNIDAGLTLNAHNVVYSDLLLHNLTGRLLVYDGVVNLDNLSATTDIGDLSLSALYAAPRPDAINFALGMKLDEFRIDKLPCVIPAIDSIMPMMRAFSGIVNAQLAVTSDITPDMYFNIPTLKAAMKFEGDSLVVFDNHTFRKMSKWLAFKNKDKNMIDHLNVEATVDNGILNLYPFTVDIDRYRLGVFGSNNLDMKLNYHVAVLKSPLPFRFGINIKGTPGDMRFSLGGAKFKENMVAERDSIASSTRINLMTEMERAFHRGVRAARIGPLKISERADTAYMSMPEELISAADSAAMIREGILAAPDSFPASVAPSATDSLPASSPSKPRRLFRR